MVTNAFCLPRLEYLTQKENQMRLKTTTTKKKTWNWVNYHFYLWVKCPFIQPANRCNIGDEKCCIMDIIWSNSWSIRDSSWLKRAACKPNSLCRAKMANSISCATRHTPPHRGETAKPGHAHIKSIEQLYKWLDACYRDTMRYQREAHKLRQLWQIIHLPYESIAKNNGSKYHCILGQTKH